MFRGGGTGARLGVDMADDAAAAAPPRDSKERAETVTNPAVRPSGLGDTNFSLTRPEKAALVKIIS